MDIEGSEVETLNALLDSGLTQTMRLVIVETHERFSHGLAKDTKSLRARIANEGHRNINLDWH
jgi:hypothetical protein